MDLHNFFKVLIVDDEPLTRQGILHHVNWENEGFFVVGEAENGQVALEMIERFKPQLIITDMVMPVMNGEVLCQEVKARYPEIEIIVLSGYGNFDYVRQSFRQGAIDYVLKPNFEQSELVTALRKSKTILNNKAVQNFDRGIDKEIVHHYIVEKILHGYQVNQEYIKTTEMFPYARFAIIGIESQLHKDALIELKRGLNDFKIYDYFKEDRYGIWLVNGNDFDSLLQILPSLGKPHDVRFYFCDCLESFHEISEIYKCELPKLVNYGFYLSEFAMITKDNLPIDTSEFMHFDIELMLTNFKNGDFDKGIRHALDYAESTVRKKVMQPTEFKMFLNNVIFSLCLEVGRQKKFNIQHDKHEYVSKVNVARTAMEGVSILESFAKKVLEHIGTPQAFHQKGIKQITEYIQENCTRPITLKSVAEKFHFNPSYFSSYFSKHHSGGFNEYLNRLRIKEAAYLLYTTEKSITEISVQSGYSDHSYFCKVFKRLMDVSPKEYRKVSKGRIANNDLS